jgi:hypothetical protein
MLLTEWNLLTATSLTASGDRPAALAAAVICERMAKKRASSVSTVCLTPISFVKHAHLRLLFTRLKPVAPTSCWLKHRSCDKFASIGNMG